MVVPASLDQLDVVNEFIARELEKYDCPMPAQMQLDVALEEMFVNVCHYAYKDSDEPGGCVVSYLCTSHPRGIVIALVDKGWPFDPLTRKDPTKPTSIQEAKIGGLGIFMTKKSVDDIAYMRAGDKNVVVFGKMW
jgi:anti-sigma regulatory factor (Ser/Thr protein kinase)